MAVLTFESPPVKKYDYREQYKPYIIQQDYTQQMNNCYMNFLDLGTHFISLWCQQDFIPTRSRQKKAKATFKVICIQLKLNIIICRWCYFLFFFFPSGLIQFGKHFGGFWALHAKLVVSAWNLWICTITLHEILCTVAWHTVEEKIFTRVHQGINNMATPVERRL